MKLRTSPLIARPTASRPGGRITGYSRAEPTTGQPAAAHDLLTVVEASAQLRVSRWTLYQLIHSRQLETIKIGRRRLIPRSAVQALIERLRAEEAA